MVQLAIGYGRSYMLAALACLLAKREERVVYCLDCRVYSIGHGEQLSHHQKTLRKKIEESILLNAANEDTEVDQEKVKRSFLEEASGKVRTHPAEPAVSV